MDNETGEPIGIDFARASSATFFSQDMNMKEADCNVPRIDYGNYIGNTKLLIEKTSTNIVVDSGLTLNLNEAGGSTSSKIDIDWFNFLTKAANLYKPSEEQTYSYLYKTTSYDTDNQYMMSFYMGTASGEIPKITNSYGTSDVKVSVRNGSSTNATLYNFVDGNTFRVSGTQNVVGTPNSGGAGAVKRYDNLDGDVYVSGYQLEIGLEMTSYIPTTTASLTRSADLLKYTLENDSKITIKTHKEIIELYRPAGEWNIHNDIPYSTGIEYISITYMSESDYTDDVVLQLFKTRVLSDGGNFEDIFIESYNTLSQEEKTSDVILLPGAYKQEVLYAMTPKGKLVDFNFSRPSFATYFDSDLNLRKAESNIPRIDYNNYANGAKILIEKSSANLVQASEILNPNNSWASFGWTNGTPTVDVPKSQNSTFIENGMCVIEFMNIEDFPLPNTWNVAYNSKIGQNLNFNTEYTVSFSCLSSIFRSLNAFILLNNGSGKFLELGMLSLTPEWQEFNITKVTSSDTSIDKDNTGFYVYNTYGNGDYTRYKGLQVELGDQKTSYIPTTGIATTRSADLLCINLSDNASIQLTTTKHTITLNKPTGLWNIHENLINEGIYKLLIKYN